MARGSSIGSSSTYINVQTANIFAKKLLIKYLFSILKIILSRQYDDKDNFGIFASFTYKSRMRGLFFIIFEPTSYLIL